MQYQQTPQGLQTLFGDQMPTAGMPAAMDLYGQQTTADALTAQDQQRELNYNLQNDPLKLARSGLDNQTLEAQLGGHRARSSMDARKDMNEATVNPQHVADLLGKFKSDDLRRQANDMSTFGDTLLQHGDQMYMNPFGAADRAKAAFEKAGHGDMWNPEWDTLPVGELANKLKSFGGDIQSHSAAFNKALTAIEARSQGQADVATINAKGKTDAAQILADARTAIAKAKAAAGNDPKNLEALATRLEGAAMMETDPAKKALYESEAKDILDKTVRVKAAGSQVTADQKSAVMRAVGIDVGGNPIPSGAMSHLKANPSLAKDFDAKYGEGAAAKVLGK